MTNKEILTRLTNLRDRLEANKRQERPWSYMCDANTYNQAIDDMIEEVNKEIEECQQTDR